MGKTILRLFKDLWSDGYKIFGAIAPLASLGFTISKALEVHLSLRNISYAWAFAPMLAWIFVAYVRRWLAYRGVENKLAEVLNAGDLEYEQHIRGIIIGYGNDLQKALRRLLKTRNANNLTSQEWERFFKDCLIDSPSNNRGPVKAELRGIVGRVLDELGA
jgi:hypothetical protein